MNSKRNPFLLLVFWSMALNSCCPQCKECELILDYKWKASTEGFDIINNENGNLIGSKIYYKDNPDGFGNVQYVKDTGHYIISKFTGQIADSVLNYKPKVAANKYLWEVGESKDGGLFFSTKTSTFTLNENFNGYKIVIQEFYKNVRQSNNTVNNILIFNGKNKISENCLPRVFDFTFDESALYIYSDDGLYKFNFEDLIRKE